jgi:hypothetical protein
MATLSSGTLVPIPFLHPSYPNRSVSLSIDAAGNVAFFYGSEVGISSGFIDVYTF